jgi:hypothetical protein
MNQRALLFTDAPPGTDTAHDGGTGSVCAPFEKPPRIAASEVLKVDRTLPIRLSPACTSARLFRRVSSIELYTRLSASLADPAAKERMHTYLAAKGQTREFEVRFEEALDGALRAPSRARTSER